MKRKLAQIWLEKKIRGLLRPKGLDIQNKNAGNKESIPLIICVAVNAVITYQL